MSYTTEGIDIISSLEYDLGRVIRVRSTHIDKCIQCYVSGQLAAWQNPVHGVVEFILTEPTREDAVALLAVDKGNETVNYWAEAFDHPADANCLVVKTPQHLLSHDPQDRWRIYAGGTGETQADVLVHQQDFYPAGVRWGGWGKHWGYGGWGFGGHDCAGWGNNWGLGEWGFDCEMLTWVSPPQGPGTYAIGVTTVNEAGNESPPHEATVVLTAAPRPAGNLSIESYDSQTDTITLTFTESEDVQ